MYSALLWMPPVLSATIAPDCVTNGICGPAGMLHEPVLPPSSLRLMHSPTAGMWYARNTVLVPFHWLIHWRSTGPHLLTTGSTWSAGNVVPWSNDVPISWSASDSCEEK
jgi:hypothetical protein